MSQILDFGFENLLLDTDCPEKIDGQRLLGYALFKEGNNTKLSYSLEKFHSDVSVRSFHNGNFIQRMQEKVATLPKLVLHIGVLWSCYSVFSKHIIFFLLTKFSLFFSVKLEQRTVTSLLEEKGTIGRAQHKTKPGEVVNVELWYHDIHIK